jgi:hypothetical protein
MPSPAIVSHRSPGRLRIKIASRKGDHAFFSTIAQSLQEEMQLKAVRTNALTGSVLILDSAVDIEAVADHAAAHDLFALQAHEPIKVPLARTLVTPVQEMDQKIKRFTAGEIDTMGTIFILLCIYGLVELLRGNAKAPPWYTAFWYAFGIFTKSMIDRSDKAG